MSDEGTSQESRLDEIAAATSGASAEGRVASADTSAVVPDFPIPASLSFDIPEDLRMLQLTVRRFVREELMPLEKRVLAEEFVSREEYDRLRQKVRGMGLWLLTVPKEYGGADLGALSQVLVMEETSKVLVGQGLFGVAPPGALYRGTPEQKDKFLYPILRGEKTWCFALTEPTGGSDPAGNMQTTAIRDGDNWVINGRKVFITGGDSADFALVFALTDREKRQHGGIGAFMVEKGTSGFTVVRTIPTMGGLSPAELDFQDCVVPDMNRLGGSDEGFATAQRTLGAARMQIGARAVGMSERLLEMGIEYAKNRVAFGKPIGERQAVQFMLADCAIEINACRWMTYRSAAKYERGEDTRLEDSIIKVYASEIMGNVADRVLQVHGGWGYTRELPIERFFRIARLWRIVEGPNEVHRWVIARALLRFGIGALRPVN